MTLRVGSPASWVVWWAWPGATPVYVEVSHSDCTRTITGAKKQLILKFVGPPDANKSYMWLKVPGQTRRGGACPKAAGEGALSDTAGGGNMAVGGRPCSGHEVEVGDWAPLSALDLHAKFADMGLKALDLEVQLGADSLRRGAFVRQGLNEDGSVQVLRRSVRERRGDLEDSQNACAGACQCACAICAVCSWHVHAWVLVQMTEPGCWPDVAAMPVVGSLLLFDAHLATPRIGSQRRVGRRRGLRGTHSSFAE